MRIPRLLALLLTLSVAATSPAAVAQSIDQLFEQGIVAQADGNYFQAELIWRRVIEIDPELALAYGNLGVALYNQGKLEEAIAAFRQAIRLQPRYGYAYNNLGIALADQGKLGGAIAAFRQVIQLYPTYAPSYNNLGLVLRQQGKIEEAIAAFRQAIQLQPKFAGAYYNLSFALREQGKIEEATLAFRQAIQLDPQYSYAVPYFSQSIPTARSSLLPNHVVSANSLYLISFTSGNIGEYGNSLIFRVPTLNGNNPPKLRINNNNFSQELLHLDVQRSQFVLRLDTDDLGGIKPNSLSALATYFIDSQQVYAPVILEQPSAEYKFTFSTPSRARFRRCEIKSYDGILIAQIPISSSFSSEIYCNWNASNFQAGYYELHYIADIETRNEPTETIERSIFFYHNPNLP